MTTTFTPPNTGHQLATFSPNDAAIAVMAEKYLPLKINGIDDAAGYSLVHKARMDVKAKRCAVETVRKELKADALEYGRKVDAEAKRLTALLTPIEEHLTAEEDAYVAEKERIKNAARLKAEAEAKAKAEAEEAARKAQQEAEAAALRAEREKIEAERKAIEAERQRIAAEQKAARAEAAEKARIETEARLQREAIEKAQAEAKRLEAEEEAKRREEALRPDREKLLAVADAVAAVVIPEVSESAKAAARQIAFALEEAQATIRGIVAKLN